jgi:hypothetical protein
MHNGMALVSTNRKMVSLEGSKIFKNLNVYFKKKGEVWSILGTRSTCWP